jgi:hypothetical protein
VLDIFSPNWFNNLPSSPRYRVAQFLNIMIEYFNKPYFILFGKGFFGTYQDYINGFTEGYLSAFTKQEFDNNTYYYVHDAINVIPLTHGLAGFIAIYSLVKRFFLSFLKSNFLIIGTIWFTIYYGFSFNISLFGVTALFTGLIEIDSYYKKNENKI